MIVDGRVARAVVSMVVIVRIMAMTAVGGMRVPFVPIRTGFRLFKAVDIGAVGLRHGGFLVRFVV
ncbi:hypothetical protein [Paraburkholderia sp. BL6665CI2N2]|uniref:hypothetical protein n=1 Tax=Paraburkholderia sp. BL6665CI2N2 TaxID=1938806 RepID=UPI0010654839|nr:hypothetical protein [Paraburkholderia sp. BL6665CI2N2]